MYITAVRFIRQNTMTTFAKALTSGFASNRRVQRMVSTSFHLAHALLNRLHNVIFDNDQRLRNDCGVPREKKEKIRTRAGRVLRFTRCIVHTKPMRLFKTRSAPFWYDYTVIFHSVFKEHLCYNLSRHTSRYRDGMCALNFVHDLHI